MSTDSANPDLPWIDVEGDDLVCRACGAQAAVPRGLTTDQLEALIRKHVADHTHPERFDLPGGPSQPGGGPRAGGEPPAPTPTGGGP
jgi:hypothetical protein